MARSGKQRARRPNATGRSDKTARFTMLPHRLLESSAYASLDLVARGLLLELVTIYNGDNNGVIHLSVLDATARLSLIDKRPALRAFDDLQTRGFITLAKESHFAVKASEKSRARCWRLTWQAWPECPQRSKRAPTNDWERYEVQGGSPASKRADRRLRALAAYRKAAVSGRLPGVKFTPLHGETPDIRIQPGVKSSPAKAGNDAIPPFVIGVKSTPYIDDTMGRGFRGWWSTTTEAQVWAHILHLHVVAQNRPKLAKAA